MSADQPPGRPFDGFGELRFAIGELHNMAVTLGSTLGADDDATQAATWEADLGGPEMSPAEVTLELRARMGLAPRSATA